MKIENNTNKVFNHILNDSYNIERFIKLSFMYDMKEFGFQLYKYCVYYKLNTEIDYNLLYWKFQNIV